MSALGRLATSAFVLALGWHAQAQGSEQPGGSEANAPAPERTGVQVEMPRLREFVAAEYPPEARDARLEATVPLHLTIDANGQVTRVEVLQHQGHGLDDAAVAAASRFRFEPARRGGQAVAAKIAYDYVFRLPAAPAPATRGVQPERPESSNASQAPSAAPSAPTSPSSPPLEVAVEGDTAADRKWKSAEAVTVVEMETARRHSADLGEVLRRTHGVSLQREGGLGSSTRFALNGLTDDQIRFFVDEVPLEFSGFGLGIATVPVNLIERVEIYRGVVPIRFGSNALGGAVNVVTDQDRPGSRASASYSVGSFGTYRLTLAARHQTPTGLFVAGRAFGDLAENDYWIDVEKPNSLGQLEPARVRRFHDGYRAAGGSVELGVLNRPWAKRLSLRVFATGQHKEIQHNAVMLVPYGEVERGDRTVGAILRYDQSNLLGSRLKLGLIAGYARRHIDFADRSRWSYDWDGRRVRERPQPIGELGDQVSDITFREHNALTRANFVYPVAEGHQLRLSFAPNYARRTGENRLFDDSQIRDPSSFPHTLLTLVTGLEYELDALEGQLENVLFVKDYVYAARGFTTYARRYTPVERDSHTQGFGDALRFRFTDWFWAKASYEYATRLPNPIELFGDGALIRANPELEPETGHNVNVGAALQLKRTPAGSVRGELNGFLRDLDRLIVHLPGDANRSTHLNVNAARATGLEAAAGWTSPGQYLWLDVNTTWMSFRNLSDSGSFAPFEGDRIPNRPWFFANASARLQFTSVNAPEDELSLTWHTHYMHSFFRGWESAGDPNEKQTIPDQTLHSAVLTYLVRATCTISSSLEVYNVADSKTFDFFGVQKPGRAFYFKGTLEY